MGEAKKASSSLVTQVMLYRYIALFITSILYCLEMNRVGIRHVTIIISGTVILTVLVSWLYKICRESEQHLKMLLVVEIIGNAFLIAFSGGLASPYIWYSCMSLFAAIILFDRKYLFFCISCYLLAVFGGTVMGMRLGNVDMIGIKTYWQTAGAFLLVLAGLRLVVHYVTEVEKQRETISHYLSYALKVYESNYFPVEDKENKLMIDFFLKEIRQEWGSVPRAYLAISQGNSQMCLYAEDITNQQLQVLNEHMGNLAKVEWYKGRNDGEGVIAIDGFLMAPVRYGPGVYGVLAVEEKLGRQTIRFICSMVSMLYRQTHLAQVNGELLRNEEQNRIAGEIHDHVVQILFGASCSLFGIQNKLDDLDQMDISQEVASVRSQVQASMTQLRETIYDMSWTKDGDNSFVQNILRYIEEIESVYGIKVEWHIDERTYMLQLAEKEALYRILRESIYNSIRHGGADLVIVDLSMTEDATTLTVADNGCGFAYEKAAQEGKVGLGLYNMKSLVQQLQGALNIESKVGEGTSIKVEL